MTVIHGTQGSALRRNGTTVSQVRSIGPVGTGGELRDVTTLSDLVHKHKKNIPDLPEISVSLYYDPQDSVHIGIFADSTLATPVPYQLVLEDGDSPGEIIDLGLCWVLGAQLESLEVDNDIVFSFTLKPQALPIGLYDAV
jgi:hypothetical protein